MNKKCQWKLILIILLVIFSILYVVFIFMGEVLGFFEKKMNYGLDL